MREKNWLTKIIVILVGSIIGDVKNFVFLD